MSGNAPDGDAFGGIMPQAAVEIPTAVGDYLTNGADDRGVETCIVERYQTTQGGRSDRD